MDTEAIEAAGIAPLNPDLQLIDAVTSVDELVAAFVKLCQIGRAHV